jgi:hypothetical protein
MLHTIEAAARAGNIGLALTTAAQVLYRFRVRITIAPEFYRMALIAAVLCFG